MQTRNHGKYTRMRKNSPRAIARCDYSGLMVQEAGLKDQMQYRGQGLVKTGYRVYAKFYDNPNAQDLTPLIKADPIPIINARPDNVVDAFVPQLLVLDVSGNVNVTLTLAQFSNINFIFKGVLTGDVTIFVPATFNDFFVDNITTGPFTLFMQITNNSNTLITLPRTLNTLINNDSFILKIIHPN